MTPATLTYLGCSAADVCIMLGQYSAENRTPHAVDALIAAIAYMRVDTIAALLKLGTPVEKPGNMGFTVETAALLKREHCKTIVKRHVQN